MTYHMYTASLFYYVRHHFEAQPRHQTRHVLPSDHPCESRTRNTEAISNVDAVAVKICYCATPSHLVATPIKIQAKAQKAPEKTPRRWSPFKYLPRAFRGFFPHCLPSWQGSFAHSGGNYLSGSHRSAQQPGVELPTSNPHLFQTYSFTCTLVASLDKRHLDNGLDDSSTSLVSYSTIGRISCFSLHWISTRGTH